MSGSTSSSERSDRIDLSLEGMTCATCASRIEGRLATLDGVDSASVNFATATATVAYDHGTVGESEFRAAVEDLGYGIVSAELAAAADTRQFEILTRKLIVAAVLSVPIALISMATYLQFESWEWLAFLLATPVVFWCGSDFHRAAIRNARHGTATMDTLVSIGTLVAWGWSTAVLIAATDGHVYFETAAIIVTLILLGKWFEGRAKRRSGDALRALAGLGMKQATLEDGTVVEIDQLRVGDRFRVKPGQKVATDGIVVEGVSAVDASMITGEPVPVEVGSGSEIVGATINVNGLLLVEATHVGADTALAQIIDLVEEAQTAKAPIQRLADRVAAVFVPVVLVVAAATAVVWLLMGQPAEEAMSAAVAVLIIACPCALGLATPTAILVGTGRGAQLGVIIRGGDILEQTQQADVIVLDKTGTLTEGRMTAATVGPVDSPELLDLVASLEAGSEHPVAAALVKLGNPRLGITSFCNHPGLGITGTVSGTELAVGRADLFDEVPDEVAALAAHEARSGSTVVLAGCWGTAQIVIKTTDQLKEGSAAAVAAFADLGLDTVMLTGDNAATARAVADEVGISAVQAEVLPAEKSGEIERLQLEGHVVAMVGDGINDAAALARADLGIAMGTGTDVAIEASDLTIVGGDLRRAADAIALSRRTLATIKGNLFWAFAYNTAAIPLAALGVLSPMIAAAAMGFSSVFVVTNSLRLRRFKGYEATSDAQRETKSPSPAS
jgi:Cu+-exporting ATPase